MRTNPVWSGEGPEEQWQIRDGAEPELCSSRLERKCEGELGGSAGGAQLGELNWGSSKQGSVGGAELGGLR